MASFYAADVLCPYYQSDVAMECTLTCEGVLPGTTVKHHFPNGTTFRQHLGRFCKTRNYKRCPWAAVCSLKWVDVDSVL